MDTSPIQVMAEPEQTSIDDAEEKKPIIRKFADKIIVMEPQARYKIAARVLHAAKYHFDHLAFLAPVDLALGWGKLSDPRLDSRLSYRQWDRFYFYHYRNPPPLSPDYMVSHSANNHLIPANAVVDLAIKSVKTGELVELSGYLVNVSGPDMMLNTSMTRTDSGAGACEVIYVQKLRIGDRVWR